MKQIIAITLLLMFSSFSYAQRVNNNQRQQTKSSKSKQNNSANVVIQRQQEKHQSKETIVRKEQECTEQAHIKEQNEAVQPQPTRQPDNIVYDVVPEMPSYPGGIPALTKYLSENVHYPNDAVSKQIQGRVIVTFIVTKTGSVSDVKVAKNVDPLLDSEAVRVVSNMSNWTPGKIEGVPVNVKYNIPINFKL